MKVRFLVILLTLNFFFPTFFSRETFCGKIPIQSPFSLQNSTQTPTPSLNQMILCKSHKLYFRTSIGLFPISSINYKNKILIVSHNSFSSSSSFISPSTLSTGLKIPPIPNSLFLLNCSNQKNMSSLASICPLGEQRNLKGFSCLVVDDVEKLDMSFHPKEWNCSHYRRVYRKEGEDEFEMGTMVSFDVPNNVPSLCEQCDKSNGNCGVGLRCICHPLKCNGGKAMEMEKDFVNLYSQKFLCKSFKSLQKSMVISSYVFSAEGPILTIYVNSSTNPFFRV